MAGGLGFLAGLGTAAEGLPAGVAAAQKLALQQGQLDETQREHLASERLADEARLTDVVPLFKTLGLPLSGVGAAVGQGSMKVPTALAPVLLTKTLADQEQQKTLARGTMMAQALERQHGTPVTSPAGETTYQITDPYIASVAQQYRVGGYDPAKHAALQEKTQEYIANQTRMRAMGPLFEQMGLPNPYGAAPPGGPPAVQAGELTPPRIVPTGGLGGTSGAPSLSEVSQFSQHGANVAAGQADNPSPDVRAAAADVGQAAQRVAQVAGAPLASSAAASPAPSNVPKLPPGVKAHLDTSTGKLTFEFGQEHQPQQSVEYVAAVNALQALEDAGVPKTDPRYVRAALRMDRLKPMPLQQGGFIAGPSGTGGPLASGPTPPVPEAVVQDIRGLAGIRRAAQGVQEALLDPAIDKYIGPYGQYGSTVQGKVPFAALGNVPESVVNLEQNLARIKNYTIKLITGAQMSQTEAQRIMQELPDQGTQPSIFRQKFKNTLDNIRAMEDTTRRLALRGDQQALLTATELGLMQPGQQSPAPPAPGAPGASVVKWGRDAQGNPVRLP